MRPLLLIAPFLLSGCATMPGTAPVLDSRTALAASAAPAQSTRNGRTQTVGLPFGRAGKIGLWAGVAVFLAYLMDSDGEDESAASPEP